MVEYTVVLIAITTALLTVLPSEDGHVGTGKSKPGDANYSKYDGSLMQAMHERYEAQSFGLRISEMPERNNSELVQYYNRLEKFPALSTGIEKVSSQLTQVNQSFNDINDGLASINSLKERASTEFNSAKEKVQSSLDVFSN
jgi:hypothetical protein